MVASLLIECPPPFGLYKGAKQVRVNPDLAALPLYRVTKVDWFSSVVSDDVFAYHLFRGTTQGFPAETTAPVRQQTFGDDPVVPFIAPGVDMNWLPVVALETFSEVERSYRSIVA